MWRMAAGAIAALVAGVTSGAAMPAPASLTCTNPANGWQWKIRVDYANAKVDSLAAKINDNEISWHDPKDDGNYTLDRHSGVLSVALPSSTGGYIMQYRCTPAR